MGTRFKNFRREESSLRILDPLRQNATGRRMLLRKTNIRISVLPLPPLPQLLPGGDQFLNRPRRGQRVAVDDATLAVGPIVEVPYPMLTEQRQIAHDFLQVFARPEHLVLPGIRSPCHERAMVAYSPFVRLKPLQKVYFALRRRNSKQHKNPS